MNCAVQLHVGAQDIEGLRDAWAGLQHHPNSDFEHFLLVCRLRREVIAPFSVSLWKAGVCRGIVCGRLERTVLQPSLGYLRMPGVRATVLTLLHEGVLGTVDEAGATAVMDVLEGLVAQQRLLCISVSMMQESNPLWKALHGRASRGLGVLQPRWKIHRELTLPQEPGFLLRNMRSKHRSWIKRKERELAESFPNQVEWRWYKEIGDVPTLCREMESVARRTYQHGLGVGFSNDEETRQRLALYAGRREMRVLLLKIQGEPQGFWVGIVYRGVFHSSATGYTPEMRDFEVGTLIFLRMVDELVGEGVVRLDFGLGDAQYKERFADRSWREADARLFGPVWQSRLLRAYLGGVDSVDRQARRLATSAGVFDRVKQAWRARLRQ